VPLSAHRQARARTDRGQPAGQQNLEQSAVVIRIEVERYFDPRWPGKSGRDYECCYAGGGKFSYDQFPAHRASLRIYCKLIDDVAV